MEILKLLENSNFIKSYEIIDYRRWSDGLYYKLKIIFINDSVLFAKEYIDSNEKNYSFHWQNNKNQLIFSFENNN
ncbi:hypothetical protein MHK_004513 [Candidatus Magnetomorum sp. HK-1]|nr:hypothetical protein MHK_004513 [Candidatus Magnetomorum sp. HK-1]